DDDHQERGARPQQSRGGRERGQTRVEHDLRAAGRRLGGDQRSEQRDRQQRRDPGDPRPFEHVRRGLVADPLLGEGQHRRGDHRDPQQTHRVPSSRVSAPSRCTGRRREGSSPATTATSAAASTGSPAGSTGVVSRATNAAATAIVTASARRSRGHSRARNAAAAAASSPQAPGSATRCPASAPTRENRFQKTYTHTPAAQKPVRFSSSVAAVAASSADSSIVRCARAKPRNPPRGREGARIRPYRVLRTPSSTEASAAPSAEPPPPTTPMKANWLPPVNIT